MSKLLVLFVMLALAATTSAKAPAAQYVIKGKLFCDYCRVGYEVKPVQYIRGQLRLQCRSRQSDKEFTVDLKNQTNAHGEYMFVVNRDCGDEICEVTPVASSIRECSSPCAGRDRARVAITSNNGMVSNERYANSLAFTRTAPLSHCPQLLQQYLDLDSTD